VKNGGFYHAVDNPPVSLIRTLHIWYLPDVFSRTSIKNPTSHRAHSIEPHGAGRRHDATHDAGRALNRMALVHVRSRGASIAGRSTGTRSNERASNAKAGGRTHALACIFIEELLSGRV
jgi:hypothetical protein